MSCDGEYVIHWRDKRGIVNKTIPEGSGEASAVRFINGGHIEGVIVQVDAYSTEEDWAHNVTEDVARAIARQAEVDGEISPDMYEFVEQFAPGCQRGLRVWDRTFTAA